MAGAVACPPEASGQALSAALDNGYFSAAKILTCLARDISAIFG